MQGFGLWERHLEIAIHVAPVPLTLAESINLNPFPLLFNGCCLRAVSVPARPFSVPLYVGAWRFFSSVGLRKRPGLARRELPRGAASFGGAGRCTGGPYGSPAHGGDDGKSHAAEGPVELNESF